jgi:hypothetical protein
VVKGPHIISLDSIMVTKKKYSTTAHVKVADAVLHVKAACKTTKKSAKWCPHKGQDSVSATLQEMVP